MTKKKKGAIVTDNKERVKIKGSSSGKGSEQRWTHQLGMAPPAVLQRFCLKDGSPGHGQAQQSGWFLVLHFSGLDLTLAAPAPKAPATCSLWSLLLEASPPQQCSSYRARTPPPPGEVSSLFLQGSFHLNFPSVRYLQIVPFCWILNSLGARNSFLIAILSPVVYAVISSTHKEILNVLTDIFVQWQTRKHLGRVRFPSHIRPGE